MSISAILRKRLKERSKQTTTKIQKQGVFCKHRSKLKSLTDDILFFLKFRMRKDLSFFPTHAGMCSISFPARFSFCKFCRCSIPSILLVNREKYWSYILQDEQHLYTFKFLLGHREHFQTMISKTRNNSHTCSHLAS